MKSWYLVYCNIKPSRRERLICYLNTMDVETFAPQMTCFKSRKDRPGKFRKCTRPLFPNYLFLRFDYQEINFEHFDSIEGIAYFLRSSGRICIIPDQLINDLSKSTTLKPKSTLSPCTDVTRPNPMILAEKNEEERVKFLKLTLEDYRIT